MNAQEAIEYLDEELEMRRESVEELFEEGLISEKEATEYQKALSIVLESAKLFHQHSEIDHYGTCRIFTSKTVEIISVDFAKKTGIEKGAYE